MTGAEIRPQAPPSLRCLELYCGIGGFAAAVSGSGASVVAAVDVNLLALGVYRANFPHAAISAHLDTFATERLAQLDAELWWASPPCQPFTRRGLRRGLGDPRGATFRALLGHLDGVRPKYFAMENVVGFAGSDAHRALRRTLSGAGYRTVREMELCPSELGIPNRRPRFYLVAARGDLRDVAAEPTPSTGRPGDLQALLDPEPVDEALRPGGDLLKRYDGALHIVDPTDPSAVTGCFTSAYGRSPVRSGSYLRAADGGVRRFSPSEILRLLGFPAGFRLPAELTLRQGWRLVGNSLSLEPVRRVLAAVPELSALEGPSPLRRTGVDCETRTSKVLTIEPRRP
ncbi:MAG: DNA cytosine methyltransferase [Acidobacteriota bacterium]